MQAQYLIAVSLRCVHYPQLKERSIYRVPTDAPLIDVVEAAKNRSELLGEVTCTGVELLGTLEPHLFDQHTSLLDPQDTTDMALLQRREGHTLRVGDTFRVFWNGRLCSPEWKERGPALAYLAGLRRGRKPEFIAG